MADLLGYKCPCCGGKIEFNSAVQQMKCPYCETTFDVATLQSYDQVLNEQPTESEMDWGNDAGGEWDQAEAAGMRVYKCQSCGGEVMADGTTAASQCPYCDAPVIMTGQLSGELKPDFVIPFKLDKEQAKAALKKHMEGKPLLPKVFKSENHIDEIKGVYVPVWLFQSDVDADFNFKATKVRTWSDNQFDYRETSYYSAVRSGALAFDNVPVDGSEKMDDTLMESLEPFDFKQAVPFQTAYLSGYLADKYDVDAKASVGRANERIRQSTRNEFRKTVQGYDTVEINTESIRLRNGETHYALYPAWLLNTSWNGKKYTFAMNGQSGKFVGNLPSDKGKMVLFFLIGFLIAGVLGYLITSKWHVALIAGAIVGAIVLLILHGQLKSVVRQSAAAEYIRKGSMQVRRKQDMYLYKNLDRTPRQQAQPPHPPK